MEFVENRSTLKRSLTLFSVVFLGLAWNCPMVFFQNYGISMDVSQGALTISYILAFVAILFTALSYAKMSRVIPIAGSAYTYTQKSMGSEAGFLVGWAILLDYILTPMITSLASAIFLNAEFPSIPFWAWFVILTVGVTVVSLVGITVSANLSKLLVIIQFVFFFVFIALTIKSLLGGEGAGTLFSSQPFTTNHLPMSVILSATAIISYSFLGFDAVTTLAEETLKPGKTIPKAIIIMLLVIGVVYIASSYFSQLLHPSTNFENIDSAANELAIIVGGNALQAALTTVLIMANFTCGVSAVTSVSRILFAMGRDSVLPKSVFAYIHPRFKTPMFGILIVGLIGLTGLFMSLGTAISFISFGALIAFTFVNLSVISHYYVRNKQRSSKDTIQYLILPLIGSGIIVWLWTSLSKDAFLLGGSWLILGIIYLFFLTKMFKKRLPQYLFEQASISS
jgi:putrescine importer